MCCPTPMFTVSTAPPTRTRRLALLFSSVTTPRCHSTPLPHCRPVGRIVGGGGYPPIRSQRSAIRIIQAPKRRQAWGGDGTIAGQGGRTAGKLRPRLLQLTRVLFVVFPSWSVVLHIQGKFEKGVGCPRHQRRTRRMAWVELESEMRGFYCFQREQSCVKGFSDGDKGGWRQLCSISSPSLLLSSAHTSSMHSLYRLVCQ